MKARLTTLHEIEQELNIRLHARAGRPPAGSGSWEFRGMMRSVKQWMRCPGARTSPRGSAGRSFTASSRQQRVIVKASYTAHHPEKVAGVLRAHIKYLGRDSASLDGREGRFYDATEEAIDARQRVIEWQDDPRHFRFIVSPECGCEIDQKQAKGGGMTAYVRELMRRVEKELGTRLEWIAVNHHNTDDLHAHVLVRGRSDNGRDLRIDRHYIQHGMRQAAQEIATAWLGERSIQQVHLALEQEVRANRYTSLDALIQRQVDQEHRLRLKTQGTAAGREQRRRLAARLQHLETMGLAQRDRCGRWSVDREVKSKLRALAQRKDIIKNLYASLGPRSASVASYRGDKELIGVAFGQGMHVELRDRRYLLVRDADQELHYVRVANGEALAALEEGSLVRVQGADPQRVRTDVRIAQIARHNGGIYSKDAHRRALGEALARGDVESFLNSHERRLAALDRSGAAQRIEGGWKLLDPDALEAGQQARIRGGLGVIEILSARSIQSQITAEAWTWLDRQIHRQTQGKATTVAFDRVLGKAAQSRRHWMVERGYATLEAGKYVLNPGSAEILRQREWEQYQKLHQGKSGKPPRLLPAGACVEGQYRGVVKLHAGLFASIATANGSVLAPIQRVPPLAYGTAVRARTSTRGLAILSRLNPRTQANGKHQDREAQRG